MLENFLKEKEKVSKTVKKTGKITIGVLTGLLSVTIFGNDLLNLLSETVYEMLQGMGEIAWIIIFCIGIVMIIIALMQKEKFRRLIYMIIGASACIVMYSFIFWEYMIYEFPDWIEDFLLYRPPLYILLGIFSIYIMIKEIKS